MIDMVAVTQILDTPLSQPIHMNIKTHDLHTYTSTSVLLLLIIILHISIVQDQKSLRGVRERENSCLISKNQSVSQHTTTQINKLTNQFNLIKLYEQSV